MTVGDKLHQTLSSLESAKAQLETFGLETQDKQAQQMYNSCANQLEQVVSQLRGRINYVESQEPQYKVRQGGQGTMQQGTTSGTTMTTGFTGGGTTGRGGTMTGGTTGGGGTITSGGTTGRGGTMTGGTTGGGTLTGGTTGGSTLTGGTTGGGGTMTTGTTTTKTTTTRTKKKK